jgi:hypothetical protein
MSNEYRVEWTAGDGSALSVTHEQPDLEYVRLYHPPLGGMAIPLADCRILAAALTDCYHAANKRRYVAGAKTY